jgi:hypothetical protein
MAEKIYDKAELSDAIQLAEVIASVPAEKRPAFIRMMQAMVLGVEMANQI